MDAWILFTSTGSSTHTHLDTHRYHKPAHQTYFCCTMLGWFSPQIFAFFRSIAELNENNGQMSLLGHNQTTTINGLASFSEVTSHRPTVQNGFNLSSVYHCIFYVIIIRHSHVPQACTAVFSSPMTARRWRRNFLQYLKYTYGTSAKERDKELGCILWCHRY